MSGRRYAAMAVLLGSFGVIVGSITTWGTCPNLSCGSFGLMSLWERSGVSWGPGILTLILGVLLAGVAIDTLRGGTSAVGRWVGLGASIGVLGVTLAWVIRMYVFPEVFLYGPGYGAYLVALGAITAAIASPSLRVRPVPRA